MGWLDEATSHMKRLIVKSNHWTKERVLESAKPLKTQTAWKNEFGGAWAKAVRNDWIQDACAHMDFNDESLIKKQGHWNKERVIESASKFKTQAEWRTNEPSALSVAIKKGWIEESIKTLQENGNIGMTGPKNTNGNTRILTQCLVHRKHIDIFGFFFPEEIKNWYCDDWINDIYPRIRIPEMYTCFNSGGEPRYTIEHSRELCQQLVNRDKKILERYKNENTC